MFLKDHEIAPRQYEISAGIWPSSVRDQMVRGIEVTEHLIACGHVPKKVGRLLIIGGGVAGVSAALCAARRGVSVTLLERNKTLFSTFAGCATRRIDPTLYDWPSAQWRTNQLRTGSPLAFRAGNPRDLADEWNRVVASKETRWEKKLCIRRGDLTSVLPLSLDADGRPTIPMPNGGSEQFDAVIYAAGMGEEKTYLGDTPPKAREFIGDPFWENDKLQEPYLGCKAPPRVLIVGSGDGALQDYIRVVTGRHPAFVIDLLDKALRGSISWSKIQQEILCAQDGAMRHYCLGLTHFPNGETELYYKERDVLINKELHDQFEKCIRRIYSGKDKVQIDSVFESMIENRGLPKVLELIVQSRSFTWCFALNRFLVLLLHRYIISMGDAKRRTLGLGHGETIKWQSAITMQPMKCSTGWEAGITSADESRRTSAYDIIIVRIGLIPPKRLLYSSLQFPRGRQMMPRSPLRHP